MARSQRNSQKEKLSRKEKMEQKKDAAKMREQLKTIVLPTIGVVFAFIIFYVFSKTRSFPVGKLDE